MHERASENETAARWRVGPFLRPVRGLLVLVLFLMSVGIALGLLQPTLVRLLIDRVLLEGREDRLWMFAAALVGAGLVRFSLGIVQARAYAAMTTRVLLDLRLDFLAHLQRLDLRFFAGTRFGDIITRFNRDLSQLQEIATGALLGFVTQILTLVGAIAWGIAIEPGLFLLAASPFPVALGIAVLFRLRIRRLTQGLRTLSQDLASAVTETIIGMRTVRTFGRERGELARFAGIGHRLLRAVIGFQMTHAFASGLPRICLLASSVIMYWVGGARVIRGDDLELGELIALGLYLTIAFGPLGSLIELGLQVVGARVSLERVREMREMPPGIEEDPAAPDPGPLEGKIEIDHVTFRHRPDQPLLEGVELRVEPGERVALIGRSGVGKSTLIDLLLGFIDPESGTVHIGGHDLRTVKRARVRDRMGVVAAVTDLFYGTVADNIRFGAPRATDEQVATAAERAGLLGSALSGSGLSGSGGGLPAGLDTVVGERGQQLSAGERQRIGLARALVREPAILILDEATSDLDPETERAILDRLETLPGRPTILAVTHRSEVMDWAERSLTLEEGRLREVSRGGT